MAASSNYMHWDAVGVQARKGMEVCNGEDEAGVPEFKTVALLETSGRPLMQVATEDFAIDVTELAGNEP